MPGIGRGGAVGTKFKITLGASVVFIFSLPLVLSLLEMYEGCEFYLQFDFKPTEWFNSKTNWNILF